MLTLFLKQQEDEEIFKSVRDDLPAEMTQYKFLLNPVRLNIMKLLYDNYNLTSIQIKDNLNLTWSEYSHNILALEEQGYIIIQSSFQYGIKRNIVYLEEKGKKNYEKLIGLLHEFLLGVDEEYLSDISKDSHLYPRS